MRDPTYPLVPVSSSLAACLIILTLASTGVHGKYNRGVVMLGVWVLLGDLITAVQAVIWSNTSDIVVPVFCDITSHLAIGLTIGIPGCIFVITRHLWLSINGHSAFREIEHRKEVLMDYFLGVGLPVLQMAIYFIVLGVRFQIVEGYGCATAVYQSGVAIILLDIWPPVLAVVSASLYCWRIVLHLHRHQRAMREVDRDRGGFRRLGRIRIILLGYVYAFFSAPGAVVGVISLFLTVDVPDDDIPFWPGWEPIHTDWEPLATSMQEWRADKWFTFRIYWNQWINVLLSLAFFVLFGLTRDSRDMYWKAVGRTRRSLQHIKAWNTGVLSSTPIALSADDLGLQDQLPSPYFDKTSRISTEPPTELVTLQSWEGGSDGLVTVYLHVDVPPETMLPVSAVRSP
ncbi:hypothetical protein PENSPDRAFT_609782 [Peniophora sp. CONT]|nr:hypothetical protein PENSPDRAFT_609782 [Peniophora sp. CONT]